MIHKKFHVRKAAHPDAPLLARVIRDSFKTVAQRFDLNSDNCPKHPSNCTLQWIEADMTRGACYYIMEENGEAVGCVALEQADETGCYLERLAVLPHCRKNGYGKILVIHVLEQARGLGLEHVGIGIIAEDEPLKHWYEQLGFVSREVKTFAHLPFTVEFMTIDLTGPPGKWECLIGLPGVR